MKYALDSDHESTVLLVDDDPAFLRVMARALGRLGFNVWPASNIEEATEAAVAVKPDFAVIDLHLGDQSGLDALEAIKKLSEQTEAIILSGYINLNCAVTATKLGAADCLPKPTEPEEIVKAMTSRQRSPARSVTKPEKARLNHIVANWEKNDRNTTKTAKDLKMQRRTLQRILNRLGAVRKGGESLAEPTKLTKLRRVYRVWARQLLDHDEPMVRM